MATFLSAIVIIVSFMLIARTALGGISCEKLPTTHCAFSISSEGMRCVLEKCYREEGRKEKLECKTSDVFVPNMFDWIETNKCIRACGVERKSLGISSDLLWQPKFIRNLCSSSCYYQCPNIVDLFFNLAAGEGFYLPKLCQRHRHEHEPVQAPPAEAPRYPGGTSFGPYPAESPIYLEGTVFGPYPAESPIDPEWPSFGPYPVEAPISGDLPSVVPSPSPTSAAESPIIVEGPSIVAQEPYPFDSPPLDESPSSPPASF